MCEFVKQIKIHWLTNGLSGPSCVCILFQTMFTKSEGQAVPPLSTLRWEPQCGTCCRVRPYMAHKDAHANSPRHTRSLFWQVLTLLLTN